MTQSEKPEVPGTAFFCEAMRHDADYSMRFQRGLRTTCFRFCPIQPNAHAIAYFALLVVSLFTLLGLPARAQLAGKGSIKGTITDPTNAVVPNATVAATSNTRGTTLSTRSTSAGDYELSPLDPDIYTVTTTAQGFSKTTQENVRVNALEFRT